MFKLRKTKAEPLRDVILVNHSENRYFLLVENISSSKQISHCGGNLFL